MIIKKGEPGKLKFRGNRKKKNLKNTRSGFREQRESLKNSIKRYLCVENVTRVAEKFMTLVLYTGLAKAPALTNDGQTKCSPPR